MFGLPGLLFAAAVPAADPSREHFQSVNSRSGIVLRQELLREGIRAIEVKPDAEFWKCGSQSRPSPRLCLWPRDAGGFAAETQGSMISC